MTKQPLDFALYQELEIDQQNSAFVFTYTDVDASRILAIEDDLITNSYKIIKVETITENMGKFKLIIVAIEPKSFTF
jgi:hypothetical protein